jgi:hypothetical protein
VIAFAAFGALVVAGLETAGCEEAYEPACRVARDDVVVADPAIGSRPSLTRARAGVIASWAHREPADGGTPGIPPPLSAFEVAVVDDRGGLGLRARVPVPDALHARRGGVASAGVIVEDGAFLVHWIETTTTTASDGLLRTDAALKAAHVRDGVASAPMAPVAASCERCTMTIASAALGSESILIARVEPDRTGAPPGASATTKLVALRLRRDGSLVEEPVPWLAVPVGSGDAGPGELGSVEDVQHQGALSVDVDDSGRLVIVTSGFAWLADEALRLVAGPLSLPATPDARVAWDVGGEASVAWSVSPYDDGRSSEATVPREIFTGLVPAGASGIATRERASRGRAALAFDRRGEEVGILFESAARTIFATVDPKGRKRGGDLVLRTSHKGAASEYGTVVVPESHVLFARGNGRFTAVAFGSGELRASEISCAP